MSPTANQHDAIELALADYQEGFGHPLSDLCEIDVVTGEIKPVVTVVTNNGGPFRSFLFEAFMLAHRDLAHVHPPGARRSERLTRTRVQDLQSERLYVDEIDDAVMLAKHAEEYRIE